ncbi:maturase K [Trifolium repens]|nr:maturase K [Trifolium repens]
MSISFANFIPASKASYSAWLLLALKANLNDCSMRTLSGPSNTTPAPLPLMLEAPSTDRVQGCSLFSSAGVVSSSKKSASIYDLMAPLGEKVMSNSDNSTDHATIPPARSGFLNTFLIG